MKKEPITISGKNNLEKELSHLIKNEREELKRIIGEARELGDLKENAEYHSAKEKQSLIEGRISQLQNILNNCIVIDIKNIKSETIVFGAKITLLDTEKDSKLTITIVGINESDSKQSKISYGSPLGKALIGKSIGDTVIVQAPKGTIEYEILDFIFE
jgi:transcription elongation factor GreA